MSDRHASVDELADLDAGVLRARKAARVERHKSGCPQCSQLSSQLTEVPNLLASASMQYPSMPDNLSSRVDTALAGEASERQAGAPQTEAGRRDLPASGGRPPGRRRPGTSGSGWRLPGFSVAASRAMAAAAAVVVVGGAGYAIATSIAGNNPTTSSSSGKAPAAVSGPASQAHVGPKITYGNARTAQSIQTVTSATNFEPGKLASQVTVAVRDARLQGVHSDPAPSASSSTAHSPAAGTDIGARPGQTGARLAGCISLVAPGRKLLLVELAKFEGKPATIIVTSHTSSRAAEVWIVGQSCSAGHSDVLDHLTLPRI